MPISPLCFYPRNLPKGPHALPLDLRKVPLQRATFCFFAGLMTNCRPDPREKNRLNGLTDEELVNQLRLGRTEAFDALYHRYKRAIYTFCLKLTGDRFLAEDATHDTFVRMLQNVASLDDASLFRTWLYAIARNRIYTVLRRERTDGQLDEESVWDEETPSSLLETKEEAAIVARCIEALKPEYKEVLLLREYEQLSYAEIAAITGDTESSVKSRLFHARRGLARRLRQYFDS